MELLLHDLALILIVAGITAVVFKALKQPLVLGYILAGFLTGPYFEYIPTVNDLSSLDFWGQIGVIFLLFGLGLEFNIKKLFKVGPAGFITVMTEVLIMFTIGIFLGHLLGWGRINSLFLGGMLSISSTSIVIKAFDELGLRNKKFAQTVFGVLVVEDIVAVLLLVVLSAIGGSDNIDGPGMLNKMIYLVMFLLLWFTGGIYLLPSIFRKIRVWVNDEILLLISIGLCFAMVVITQNSGFSPELGAFMMGSILSGTCISEKMVRIIRPLKDFFGAIFFVTVGMLVNPEIIAKHWGVILLIGASVVVFKTFAASLGLTLSGQTIKGAMQSGFCLCQIGEFSFIIANLGQSLGVMNKEIYPIVVSVSILTIFLTPYVIKSSEPVYDSIYRHIPKSWRPVIDRLGTGHRTIDRQNDWNVLLRKYLSVVLVYTGWIVFVIIVFTTYVNPYLSGYINGWRFEKLVYFLISVFAISPFMYGLMRKRSYDAVYERIWNDSKFSRGPLLSMRIFKYVISAFAVSYLVAMYLTKSIAAVLLISVFVVLFVIYSKFLKNYYIGLENNFLDNYHFDRRRAGGMTIPRQLADEMHTEILEIGVASRLAGMTIRDIHKTYATGAFVLWIHRGSQYISLPDKNEYLLPGDKVMILGEDAQVNRFMEYAAAPEVRFAEPPDMDLFHYTIDENSGLVGKDANITRFREGYGLILVAVDRTNVEGLLKPTSSVILEKGDTLWIAGDKEKARSLMSGEKDSV